jgi:hypothetical protein
MAVFLIKDAISVQLNNITYRRHVFDEQPSVKSTFKEILLKGDNIEVNVFSEREFEVKVPENVYNLTLATDFWFSYQKVTEHKQCFSGKSSALIPSTWLIVSAYYSAFYSAVELSRLYGIYNLYLKKENCDAILNYLPAGIKLDKGNYVGVVHHDITDYVTIRFTAKKNIPTHESAWSNILKILNHHNITDVRTSKKEVFKLLNSVLDSNKKGISTPNTVRNEWNYSYPNAYDKGFCNEINDIKTYLSHSGRQSITSWPSKYKKLNTKQNNVFSVIYLEMILRQVMEDLKVKIYELGDS